MELGYEITPKHRRYLYDLSTDPFQQNPLDLSIPENQSLAHQYEQDVLAWLLRQNDEFSKLWIQI